MNREELTAVITQPYSQFTTYIILHSLIRKHLCLLVCIFAIEGKILDKIVFFDLLRKEKPHPPPSKVMACAEELEKYVANNYHHLTRVEGEALIDVMQDVISANAGLVVAKARKSLLNVLRYLCIVAPISVPTAAGAAPGGWTEQRLAGSFPAQGPPSTLWHPARAPLPPLSLRFSGWEILVGD